MKDQLLTKHMLGESNFEEKRLVEHWIAQDPANKRHYRRLLAVWEMSKQVPISAPQDVEEAWQRFLGHKATHQGAARVKAKSLATHWMSIAAAALALVLVGVLFFFMYTGPRGVSGMDLATKDKVLKDTLYDGTIVTLNKQSSMHYVQSFFHANRTVSLDEGEVFFDVVRNEQKPFEVRVGDLLVTVLGTSFNVKRGDGEVEITVSSGLVKVARKGKELEVTANQRLRVDETTNAFVTDAVQDQLYKYYLNNRFVLTKTPLHRVTQVLSKAYGVPIIIENPSLKELLFTTTFERGTLEEIMAVIGETLQVKVIKKGNKFIIR